MKISTPRSVHSFLSNVTYAISEKMLENVHSVVSRIFNSINESYERKEVISF